MLSCFYSKHKIFLQPLETNAFDSTGEIVFAFFQLFQKISFSSSFYVIIVSTRLSIKPEEINYGVLFISTASFQLYGAVSHKSLQCSCCTEKKKRFLNN